MALYVVWQYVTASCVTVLYGSMSLSHVAVCHCVMWQCGTMSCAVWHSCTVWFAPEGTEVGIVQRNSPLSRGGKTIRGSTALAEGVGSGEMVLGGMNVILLRSTKPPASFYYYIDGSPAPITFTLGILCGFPIIIIPNRPYLL